MYLGTVGIGTSLAKKTWGLPVQPITGKLNFVSMSDKTLVLEDVAFAEHLLYINRSSW